MKVSTVEVKDVELPQGMQRAMARQAEAERERRAKIINADGELQASERLAEAGRIMSEQPATLQLRFLQTLSEIATEKNSTIVFPVPIDLIAQFTQQFAPRPAPIPTSPARASTSAAIRTTCRRSKSRPSPRRRRSPTCRRSPRAKAP